MDRTSPDRRQPSGPTVQAGIHLGCPSPSLPEGGPSTCAFELQCREEYTLLEKLGAVRVRPSCPALWFDTLARAEQYSACQ